MIASPRNAARAQTIADRLWQCTHGSLGRGDVGGAGLTSELIVNVDSRGDGAVWDEYVDKYASGSFVTALLSNNLHEVHGYNRAAAVARGEVVMLLQDDEIPPRNCAWLKYVIALYNRWPRLGAIGMRRGDLWHPLGLFDKKWIDSGIRDPGRCRTGTALRQPLHRRATLPDAAAARGAWRSAHMCVFVRPPQRPRRRRAVRLRQRCGLQSVRDARGGAGGRGGPGRRLRGAGHVRHQQRLWFARASHARRSMRAALLSARARAAVQSSRCASGAPAGRRERGSGWRGSV